MAAEVSLTVTVSAAEIVFHPWNCVASSALRVYRHCSCKEDSAGLFMLRGVSKVSWFKTVFFPHRLKAGLTPLSGLGVLGYARLRKE